MSIERSAKAASRPPLFAFLLIFGLLSTVGVNSVSAQPDSLPNLTPPKKQTFAGKVLFWLTTDTTDGTTQRFLAYPTFAYAPETGLDLGIRSFTLFHAKGDTLVTRLSEVNALAFVTLKGQFGVIAENAFYTYANRYYFFGRFRYQQFPLLYYGIGPRATAENPTIVESNLLQFRQRALRQVIRDKDLYAGLEIDYQSLSRVSFGEEYNKALPDGANGASNFGFGGALVYDSRENVLNPRKGFFVEIADLWYGAKSLNTHPFNASFFDARVYIPTRPRELLALQAYGSNVKGDAPFNNLSLLGGENLMRGYYLGRYRDKTLAATQVEYRFLPLWFSKRIGAAAFASAGTVAPSLSEIQLRTLKWSAGAGVRYLFFKKKDVYLRGDIAFTPEGQGYYIFLGEAF
jgi:hypothetical protein